MSSGETQYRVASVRVASARDLVDASEALNGAWFRGEGNPTWRLKSTLERDAERFGVARHGLWERERAMLRLFKQLAHLYANTAEYPRSEFEWYALIRHYGGPSRLLDITSSCFVGAYFALAGAQPARDGVVWAFRNGVPTTQLEADVDAQFQRQPHPEAIIAVPERANVRLSAQSGAFFVPGCVETSLEAQLGKMYNTDFNVEAVTYRSVQHITRQTHHKVWKLVIPRAVHGEIFRFLASCNIRGYLLVPGPEGLANSLREVMRA